MEIPNRHTWIDNSRGIGILLVVYGHMLSPGSFLYNWIYSFHVPLFFFLAGYLFKERPFTVVLKRSGLRLMLPYFSFAITTYIFWFVIGRKVGAGVDTTSPLMALSGVFLGSNWGDYLVFNRPLWFLPGMFCMVAFHSLISPVFKNRWSLFVIAATLSIYASYTLATLPMPVPLSFLNGLAFYPYFVMGKSMAHIKFLSQTASRLRLWTLAGLFIMHFALFYIAIYVHLESSAYFLLPYCGIAMVVYGAVILGDIRIMSWLGQNTLPILCLHGIFTGAVRALLVKAELLFSMREVESFIILLGVMLICVPVCYLLRRYLPWSIGEIDSKTKE